MPSFCPKNERGTKLPQPLGAFWGWVYCEDNKSFTQKAANYFSHVNKQTNTNDNKTRLAGSVFSFLWHLFDKMLTQPLIPPVNEWRGQMIKPMSTIIHWMRHHAAMSLLVARKMHKFAPIYTLNKTQTLSQKPETWDGFWGWPLGNIISLKNKLLKSTRPSRFTWPFRNPWSYPRLSTTSQLPQPTAFFSRLK